MIRTIIVEDDLMVAAIDKKYANAQKISALPRLFIMEMMPGNLSRKMTLI